MRDFRLVPQGENLNFEAARGSRHASTNIEEGLCFQPVEHAADQHNYPPTRGNAALLDTKWP
jgi:hypothetical protein